MKSLRLRCSIVTLIFIAIMVVSGVAATFDYSLFSYVQGIAAGEEPDPARAGAINARQRQIAYTQLVLIGVCAIAFLMWLYRAHKNLGAAGIDGLQFSSGWAVGYFFVPLFNLVRPYQAVEEVAAGSAYLSAAARQETWQRASFGPLVKIWVGPVSPLRLHRECRRTVARER